MCSTRTVIKTILVFIISFAGAYMLTFPPYTFIIGFVAAAIYFTILRLRSLNEEYERRVKNGLKWMVVSLVIGILPYFTWVFIIGSTSFIYTPLGLNVTSLIQNYPFLLGPYNGLTYIMIMHFPHCELNTAIAVATWLLVPFIVGFLIAKSRSLRKKKGTAAHEK